MYGGGSIKKNGLYDTAMKILKDAGLTVFELSGVEPNPKIETVRKGVEICKNEGIDMVLAIGGGSTIDSAKAIAVMACNEGDFWNYVTGGTGKGRPVTKALPIVAIPTTAGTGTEVDPWAVITNEEKQEKIGFGCPLTFPTLSIIDPELMVSIPKHLKANQGFDAFFHAAEGFIAN